MLRWVIVEMEAKDLYHEYCRSISLWKYSIQPQIIQSKDNNIAILNEYLKFLENCILDGIFISSNSTLGYIIN